MNFLQNTTQTRTYNDFKILFKHCFEWYIGSGCRFKKYLQIISVNIFLLTSKNKWYNLPTFRRLYDAIIKGTNENKINKLQLIYIAEVDAQIL